MKAMCGNGAKCFLVNDWANYVRAGIITPLSKADGWLPAGRPRILALWWRVNWGTSSGFRLLHHQYQLALLSVTRSYALVDI